MALLAIGASLLSQAGGAVGSVLRGLTSLGKGRNMNPVRLAHAQLCAKIAIEGGSLAVVAARGALGGSLGMHDRNTAEGQGYWRDAWALIEQYAPANVVAEARRLGGTKAPDREIPPPSLESLGGGGQSALEGELSRLITDLRDRTAQSVARIGAGATTAATNAVAGSSAGEMAVTVPVSSNTLLIVGAVLGGALLLRGGRQ